MGQEETDHLYQKLVDIINSEMSLYLKKLYSTLKSKKAYRHVAQEWWDEEVEDMWKAMHAAEKDFMKVPRHDKTHKPKYKTFIAKQQLFDKRSKAKKRRKQRNKVLDIE